MAVRNFAKKQLSALSSPYPIFTKRPNLSWMRWWWHNIIPYLSAAFYLLLCAFTIIRIILDTKNSSKTLAYILLVVLFPLAGPVFYFAFGGNYRRKKMFSRKIIQNDALYQRIENHLRETSLQTLKREHNHMQGNEDLVKLLLNDSKASLSYNKVQLLINGEQKFPEVIAALEQAETFIHLEYYIFDNDEIGNSVIDVLKRKALEGVEVRFIYDDFGTRRLTNDQIVKMEATGIQVYPFYEIKFFLLANRINYRDHRKLIIVDGQTGFLGGINISDRYINRPNAAADHVFWRDTHIRLTGPAVSVLQYHFIANWNFCSDEKLEVGRKYFPVLFEQRDGYDDLVQIVAGGPDYPTANVMLSYFTAIVSARKRVYITSPYFIPNESIYDALKKAALSGKDVRLLVPGNSDSRIVNAAAHSYFREMLESGVRIFEYRKGFVHAKTMVVDDHLSIVGTANMDVRSFDLNFEMNAVIYSRPLCDELTQAFMIDCSDADEISLEAWNTRGRWRMFLDDCARLLSPLL